MQRLKRACGMLALGFTMLSLAACVPAEGVIDDGGQVRITLKTEQVAIQVKGHPDARISALGDLRIGTQELTVDGEQRMLMVRYYRDALAIHQSGVAMSKSGAALAGSVLGNLLTLHFDRLDKDANRDAQGITAEATELCDQIDALRTTQDAISRSVPAFRTYATLKASDVEHCRKGIHD